MSLLLLFFTSWQWGSFARHKIIWISVFIVPCLIAYSEQGSISHSTTCVSTWDRLGWILSCSRLGNSFLMQHPFWHVVLEIRATFLVLKMACDFQFLRDRRSVLYALRVRSLLWWPATTVRSKWRKLRDNEKDKRWRRNSAVIFLRHFSRILCNFS